MMKQIIQTALIVAGIGFASLLATIQTSLAQGTSCTVPSGHTYGTISGSAGSLICSASSSTGASLSNKITLSALSANGFHIGHVNTVGHSYIRALSSISVSGGGSCSASGGQYHTCSGLVGGSSVISFTDGSLSEFGTISFKWGTGPIDSGLIG